MDDHYRRNHHRMPHERLVSGIDPQRQQGPVKVNHPAYIWLYICLIVALVVLALMAFAMYLDHRRKKAIERKELEERRNRKAQDGSHKDENKLYPNTNLYGESLYPNPEIEEKSSLFDGSVTTTASEIQPKVPPLSCEKIDEMSRKSSSFGTVNVHHQQSGASSTDFSMHHRQSFNTQHYPPPPASSNSPSSTPANASSISLAGNSKRMSRMESFPYEEYGIPENERQPIKTRVKDLKTYDHFLHLTQVDSEFLREDSVAEEEHSGNGSSDDDLKAEMGRFESQATLPRTSVDNSSSTGTSAPAP